MFAVFLLNQPIFEKKQSLNEHLRLFSDKSGERMVREKTYRLKLEFYNTDRKMKSIIRRVFFSIIMHLNFMHFRLKVSFKSTLKSFPSVSEIIWFIIA